MVFSPKDDFLITLGDANDRGMFVWDWQNQRKISQNRLSKPVLAIAFAPDQSFFITGGYQHLKLWHMDPTTKQPVPKVDEGKKTSILSSDSADLTKVKERQVFVGLAIAEGNKIFALTIDGLIYVYNNKGEMQKWMNIKVPRAFSCKTNGKQLFCACADGIIRVFSVDTLHHLLSLSKPPPLGASNAM